MGEVILVTGANGFVGRTLVEHFLHQGTTVIATDLHNSLAIKEPSLHSDSPGAIRYYAGDLGNAEFVQSLGSEFSPTVIVHLAAIISQKQDPETRAAIMNANIQATFNICELARTQGSRIIFPSTALVYGSQPGPFTETMLTDPVDFYALSKLVSEQLIRYYEATYQVPSVVFRIGILYGLSQSNNMFIPSIVSAMLNGTEFPMTPGEQTRDFVFIRDFIEAIECVIERPTVRGVFHIGTGHAPTLREVASIVEQLTGTHKLLKLGAVPYRANESMEYCVNADKAKSELCWQARTSLAEGLRLTINYMREKRVAQAN